MHVYKNKIVTLYKVYEFNLTNWESTPVEDKEYINFEAAQLIVDDLNKKAKESGYIGDKYRLVAEPAILKHRHHKVSAEEATFVCLFFSVIISILIYAFL